MGVIVQFADELNTPVPYNTANPHQPSDGEAAGDREDLLQAPAAFTRVAHGSRRRLTHR